MLARLPPQLTDPIMWALTYLQDGASRLHHPLKSVTDSSSPFAVARDKQIDGDSRNLIDIQNWNMKKITLHPLYGGLHTWRSNLHQVYSARFTYLPCRALNYRARGFDWRGRCCVDRQECEQAIERQRVTDVVSGSPRLGTALVAGSGIHTDVHFNWWTRMPCWLSVWHVHSHCRLRLQTSTLLDTDGTVSGSRRRKRRRWSSILGLGS